jgi:hypothetical protein
MTRYRLLVHCNVCDALHSLPLACSLDDGPRQTTTVAAVFNGKAVPDWLASVTQCTLTCTATGSRFTPEDNTQIFLVPLEG